MKKTEIPETLAGKTEISAGVEPPALIQAESENIESQSTDESTSTGCTAAAISPANVTQETESTSPGKPPGASTMLLPTEGRNVVKIQPKETSIRSRAPMVNALLIVAEENRARVAATNGHPWSVGQAHIDSPKSSKYGISLAAGLRVLGVERLNRGDFVEIEVCSGNTCHQLTGRASRKAAAYYSKSDLVQAGVQVHTPFHYVVLHVVPAGQNPINVEGQL